MSGQHLANRDNWQLEARKTGDLGENKAVEAIRAHLPSHYKVRLKPPKIPIYSDGKGIVLDAEVYNSRTEKRLFVECKRGNRGGNATEERAYKYATAGMKRAVRALFHDVCEEPFFTILSGKIFNGESGDYQPFVIERVNKQGKTVRSKIVPATYREKVSVGLWGENYAFADHDFSNAEEIATQIMEIV